MRNGPRPFSIRGGALVLACALILFSALSFRLARARAAAAAATDDPPAPAAPETAATQPSTEPATQPAIVIGTPTTLPTTRPLRRRAPPAHAVETKPGTAVPGLAAQEVGIARVRDIFSSDYRDPSYNARRALAKKLIDQGDQTLRDTDAKYIFYREARDVAAGAGDVPTAFEAIDHIAQTFPISRLHERIAALKVASPPLLSPAANEIVVARCIDLVDQCVVEDDYEPAQTLLEIAADAASRSPKRAYSGWVNWRAARLAERRAAYALAKPAAEKLKRRPEDPEANKVMGNYICLVRKEWEVGLPMIAKGNDPAFAALAERDLQCPDDRSADQYALAEAWWAWAQKESDPEAQAGYRMRSAYWHRRALPDLDGLEKATAQRRIAIAFPPPAPGNIVPRPPDVMPFNKHLYRVSIAEVSWDAAKRLCEDAGGRLVCLETRFENDYVVKLAKGRVVWLGATYDGSRKRWTWISGTDMFFIFWGQGEPSSVDGLAHPQMGTNGSWEISPRRTGFVCEWDN